MMMFSIISFLVSLNDVVVSSILANKIPAVFGHNNFPLNLRLGWGSVRVSELLACVTSDDMLMGFPCDQWPRPLLFAVYKTLHPGRLTWNLQIIHLERKIIFQTIIFRFYVNLPGCIQPNEGKESSIKRIPSWNNQLVMLDGGNSYMFLFSPRTLGRWCNLTKMFSKGLVKNHQLRLGCHGMSCVFVSLSGFYRNRLEAPEPMFHEELVAVRIRSRSRWIWQLGSMREGLVMTMWKGLLNFNNYYLEDHHI